MPGTGCDFEERDSFVYSLTNHQALEEELEALSRIGAPAVLIREPPLPFPVAGAVQFPGRPSSTLCSLPPESLRACAF